MHLEPAGSGLLPAFRKMLPTSSVGCRGPGAEPPASEQPRQREGEGGGGRGAPEGLQPFCS